LNKTKSSENKIQSLAGKGHKSAMNLCDVEGKFSVAQTAYGNMERFNDGIVFSDNVHTHENLVVVSGKHGKFFFPSSLLSIVNVHVGAI
jgi:hypothetical protein